MHGVCEEVSKVGRLGPFARRMLLGACALTLSSASLAAPPDATTAYIDTQYTYNLGPTGARGWIYNTGNEWVFAPEGLTYESRQILITTVDAATPAAGVLQVNDVILGLGSALFTNDARKAFGKAIGAAEASDGQLKLKVWRGGVTNDNVTLTLPVMGAYSATAPYNCPKSALILSNACTFMESRAFNGSTEGNAVFGLALLAAGRTQDLAKVQSYARSIAPNYTSLDIPVNAMVAWPRGYSSTFLSEYYLVTNDATVLPAIRELSTKSAMGASWVGTYGHGMAWPRLDGTSTHGAVPPYGALNQAGLMVSIGIALGEKCGATNAAISEALGMSRRYFAYFAGKGAVPYGESPPEEFNDDNGKSGEAALLLALQGQADMSPQVRFFSKSCTASYSVREFGHCGPFWAKLWQPMAVNLGGTNALAAYFKEIDWELDLSRRPDGSFVTFGTVGNDGGLDANSGTALYILTYALPLKKIYLTGKDSSTNNWLGAGDVSEAIEAGKCDLIFDMKSWTTNQLVDTLSSWSSQTRRYASEELSSRSNVAELVPSLMEMAEGTNVFLRMGAVKTLTNIGDTRAVPVLLRRLKDSDAFVRYLASGGWTASSGMLTKDPVRSLYTTNLMQILIDNARPQTPVEWDDPCQIAQSWLAAVVFNENLKNKGVEGIDTNLLYTAITTWAQGPSGWTLSGFLNTALRTNDVVALAPFITQRIMIGNGLGYDGGPYINLLAKYDYDDGIAAGMLFDRTFCGRSSNGGPDAVAGYGAAAQPTLPKLYYWNTHASDLALENVANGWLDTIISTIQNDTVPPRTLRSFKTVTSASATPTTLTLPAATVSLSSSGTTLTGDELAYSWIKAQGPGEVTFSANSTPSSSNAVATFSMPGVYVIRAAISDNFLGDGTNCFGAVFSNLVITVSDTTNVAPVAQNQSLATPLNTAKAVTLAATDANGDTQAYSIAASPGHGVLSGTVPNVTYTPTTGYTGPDSFTFTATDGIATSGTATVTIDVGGTGNRRPVADSQALTATEDTAQAITLAGSDPDADPLTYTVVSLPAHGTLSGTPPNLTYTPAADYPASYFNGVDSFTFAVSDASLTSAVASVSITVTPVEDTPIAYAQTVVMAEDVSLQAVTLSGTDPEGYPLTYTVTAYPALGTIRGAPPDLTYTPPANVFGTNTLTFTVTDICGRVSPGATVSLVVTNVNDAPRALNRSLPVTNNTPTAILLDGSDIEGDALTYTVLTQPAHGFLSGTAPNLIYTPVTNYNATDSFTFKVNDGKSDSANIATVYLSVGTVFTGIASEFFHSLGSYHDPVVSQLVGRDIYWPDMASQLPDDTRIDTQIQIPHDSFPTGYEDNFSSRHTAYVKVSTAGNYTFSVSADDNARLYVDEALVMQTIYGQSGWTDFPLKLTPGYHGIRLEFVETYGDNYVTLSWSGPGVSGVVPSSVFFRCVGNAGPLAPAELEATPGNAAISLTWTGSGRVTSYAVKRSLVPGGPYVTITEGLTAASYIDSAVTNGTTYYYVVSATGTSGEGMDSGEAYATPVATVVINMNIQGGANATMNGYASSDAAACGSASRAAPLAYAGTTWNDFGGMGSGSVASGLKNSTNGVTGVGFVWGAYFNAGPWADWTGLGGARMLVSGMIGSSAVYTNAFTLTGLSANRNYDLYIASSHDTQGASVDFIAGADDAHVGYADATDWAAGQNFARFANLVPASDGTVVVRAKSNQGYINGFQLVDLGVQAPAIPTSLVATSAGLQVFLNWAVTAGATGYSVKRSLVFGGPYTSVGTASGTNFTDSAVVSDTAYYYVVSATNAAGQSGLSDWASVIPTGFIKADQTITFGSLLSKTYGDASFNPGATASSGLAVSYASSDTSVATVSGSMVTLLKAGSTTLTASQAGDANYNAASPVPQTLTVNKATPTLTWDAPAAIVFGTALSSNQLNATSGGVAGTFTYTPPSGTMLPVGAGQTLSVNFTPSDTGNYNVPADRQVTVTVTATVLAEDFEHEWTDNALAVTTNGWTAGAGDLSSVTNPATGYDRLAGNVSFPLRYDHKVLKRRLALNSQDSTLLTPLTQAAFTNERVYVDMMVKCVVSDAFAPAPVGNTEVKAAVCLKAEGATTNLCVFHGQKAGEAFSAPGWTPVMDGASLGEWCRLTVVFDATAQGGGGEAFRVLINGQAVTSAAAYGDDWKTAAFTSPYTPAGGTWFLSAARRAATNGANPGTLDGLAFQGRGFIDDLTVTYDEPIFVHGTVILLAMGEGN